MENADNLSEGLRGADRDGRDRIGRRRRRRRNKERVREKERERQRRGERGGGGAREKWMRAE